jgi:hypothetical protein
MNNDNTKQRSFANVSTVLNILFEKAEDSLTDEEKKWLASGINETLDNEISNLHHVAIDIAGLVAEDGNAGNFTRAESVAALMYSIAHQLDVIRGLSNLSQNMATPNAFKQYAIMPAETNSKNTASH